MTGSAIIGSISFICDGPIMSAAGFCAAGAGCWCFFSEKEIKATRDRVTWRSQRRRQRPYWNLLSTHIRLWPNLGTPAVDSITPPGTRPLSHRCQDEIT